MRRMIVFKVLQKLFSTLIIYTTINFLFVLLQINNIMNIMKAVGLLLNRNLPRPMLEYSVPVSFL
jgi:hypothetical protein